MKWKLVIVLYVLSINIWAQQSEFKLNLIDGSPSQLIKTKIETNTSRLLNDIQHAYEKQLQTIDFTGDNVTEKAKQSIDAIWSSSKFWCVTSQINERLLQTQEGYEIRNIPINIDGQNEYIVLVYNHQADVDDVYFAVDEHQYKHTGANKIVVDETKKYVIRDFLESLKTAYIKKDVGFIEMVMSDKALIIVGKKVQSTNKKNFKITETGKQTLYNDNASSSYKKLTKQQYINGLKRIFKKNKNILLKYSDIEIIPHRKSGYEAFYGVRLKQKWQSDTYSDFGLLFFVIEFREDDHPLIWVRVWQDANTTSKADRIGLGEILIQPS